MELNEQVKELQGNSYKCEYLKTLTDSYVKSKKVDGSRGYEPEAVHHALKGFASEHSKGIHTSINICNDKTRQEFLEGFVRLTNGEYDERYQFIGYGDELLECVIGNQPVSINLIKDGEVPDNSIYMEVK